VNKSIQVPSTSDETGPDASGSADFMSVLDARLSRRAMLRGGVGTATAAVLGGWSAAALGGGRGHAVATAASSAITSLAFAAVAKSTADAVTVPAGYSAIPIYALGDPIFAGVDAFKNDGTDLDFDKRAGDHHDGMEYFGLNAAGTARDPNGSMRGLLAMNHEASTNKFLHGSGRTPNLRPASEVDKEIGVHGLSVVEVRRTGGTWAYVQDSVFNRRVTPHTEVELSGPIRGHALAKTRYAVDATKTRGTLSNCGTGLTPWGTYLSGEENWAGYFTRARAGHTADDAARGNDKSVASLKRYGVTQTAPSRSGWETAGIDDEYARFFIGKTGASTDGTDDYRHELNGFGYIVEMDAYNKSAAIKKRTALGRFAHESAAFGNVTAGKPLAVYMGDDALGEYIYKFVSAKPWNPADAERVNRMAVGDSYLDTGKLYAARFDADGKGDWVELSIANALIAAYAPYTFADQADVLVNARLAADAVGATKMDRPEWCAVHPRTGDMYYTLTNNMKRRVEPIGSQLALDPANPRAYTDETLAKVSTTGNVNGHIIRLAEKGGRSAATSFSWDVYLFGAEAGVTDTSINVSALTDEQDFSSPDGLWFSRNTNLCWIQTDDGSYTDVSNSMMLAGVPGRLGDGSKTTLSFRKADGAALTVKTFVGRKPVADTLKRFLVGPVDCELTGCTETPDGKTLFVNIQHPGSNVSSVDLSDPSTFTSHWPGNAGYQAASGNTTSRPRSATMAITKDDGGRIGS